MTAPTLIKYEVPSVPSSAIIKSRDKLIRILEKQKMHKLRGMELKVTLQEQYEDMIDWFIEELNKEFDLED